MHDVSLNDICILRIRGPVEPEARSIGMNRHDDF